MPVTIKPLRSGTAGTVPTTATMADGEMAINYSDRKIYLRAGASILEVANVAGLDNMLINCGIPINQRGFAGGALAAGTYGYDRWKAGTGGCNVTINPTTGVFTHTSGPLQQIVESPELAWGLPLTISVENPSGNITVSVGGSTGTITSGTGRRGVTITPSGSGNMVVQLTATGVTYVRPKLERGTIATPYVVRPQPVELMLCQRYYEKSYETTTPPLSASGLGREILGTSAATGIFNAGSVKWKVTKRATPAVTTYTINVPTTGAVEQDDGSTITATVNFLGVSGAQVNWTNTTLRWGAFFQWTADSEL